MQIKDFQHIIECESNHLFIATIVLKISLYVGVFHRSKLGIRICNKKVAVYKNVAVIIRWQLNNHISAVPVVYVTLLFGLDQNNWLR